MSGVSFSSSASQRVRADQVMSLAEFAGLYAPAALTMDSAKVGELYMRVFSDKMMAAYHAYLRKFDVGSSPVGSVVSSGSNGSRKGLAWSRASVVKERVLKSNIPVVTSAAPEGFCYLKAFKLEERSKVRAELGPEPGFFSLLAQPADRYDLKSTVRISPVGKALAHVSEDGEHPFFSVMGHMASVGRTVVRSDSLWTHLQGHAFTAYSQYNFRMGVGAPLRMRLRQMVDATSTLVSMSIWGLDVRIAEVDGLNVACFFNKRKLKGFILIPTLDKAGLRAAFVRYISNTPSVRLVCFSARNIRIEPDEMVGVRFYNPLAGLSGFLSVVVESPSVEQVADNIWLDVVRYVVEERYPALHLAARSSIELS